LLELLVCLGIIAVLLGLLLPAIQSARDAAARAACASNTRQLALAIHQFSLLSGGVLPNGCQPKPILDGHDPTYRPQGYSWLTLILPYLEQEALFQAAALAHQTDPDYNGSPAHYPVSQTIVSVFLCPSEGRRIGGHAYNYALKSYLGIAGTDDRSNDGVFHPALDVRFTDITDGTSNTVMIGERPPGPDGLRGAWYARWGSAVCPLSQIQSASGFEMPPAEASNCIPAFQALAPGRPDNMCDVAQLWSLHRGGAHFAFADGSVRFLTYGASSILPALATRAGGEELLGSF
jgi:prepilin-type processing-associated H-X9-DG protein